MKHLKIIALMSAAVICVSLTGCGGQQAADQAGVTQAPAQEENSALTALTDKYPTYAASFVSEMGEFVDGDMDTILNGIGTLDDSNFAEWNETYQKGYERCEHWFNELSASEMLCPEDKKQAHADLTATVGTIYKIMDGLKERVDAAQVSGFDELNAMGPDYADADRIAHEMWDRASAEVVE